MHGLRRRVGGGWAPITAHPFPRFSASLRACGRGTQTRRRRAMFPQGKREDWTRTSRPHPFAGNRAVAHFVGRVGSAYHRMSLRAGADRALPEKPVMGQAPGIDERSVEHSVGGGSCIAVALGPWQRSGLCSRRSTPCRHRRGRAAHRCAHGIVRGGVRRPARAVGAPPPTPPRPFPAPIRRARAVVGRRCRWRLRLRCSTTQASGPKGQREAKGKRWLMVPSHHCRGRSSTAASLPRGA